MEYVIQRTNSGDVKVFLDNECIGTYPYSGDLYKFANQFVNTMIPEKFKQATIVRMVDPMTVIVSISELELTEWE